MMKSAGNPNQIRKGSDLLKHVVNPIVRTMIRIVDAFLVAVSSIANVKRADVMKLNRIVRQSDFKSSNELPSLR